MGARRPFRWATRSLGTRWGRVAVLALVVALVAAVTTSRSGEPGDVPSLDLAPRPGPTAFRIVYRVEVLQEPPSTTLEERLVRRPFDGMLLGSRTRVVDVDDPETSGTASRGSQILSISNGHAVPVQGRIPTLAIGDQALGGLVEDAVRLGRATATGDEDRLLGRSCRVFGVKEPGARSLDAPTSDSSATVCIDDDGLVLQERWKLGGQLVFERTAIAIDERPDLGALDELVDAGTGNAPVQGTSVKAVARITSFIVEPPLPRGFRRTGRFQTASLDRAIGPVATSAWVMDRAGDFLTVEVGRGSIDQRDAADELDSPLGKATLHLGAAGPEIRIAVEGGRWVRVAGSVSPSDLEAYVATLRTRGSTVSSGRE